MHSTSNGKNKTVEDDTDKYDVPFHIEYIPNYDLQYLKPSRRDRIPGALNITLGDVVLGNKMSNNQGMDQDFDPSYLLWSASVISDGVERIMKFYHRNPLVLGFKNLGNEIVEVSVDNKRTCKNSLKIPVESVPKVRIHKNRVVTELLDCYESMCKLNPKEEYERSEVEEIRGFIKAPDKKRSSDIDGK